MNCDSPAALCEFSSDAGCLCTSVSVCCGGEGCVWAPCFQQCWNIVNIHVTLPFCTTGINPFRWCWHFAHQSHRCSSMILFSRYGGVSSVWGLCQKLCNIHFWGVQGCGGFLMFPAEKECLHPGELGTAPPCVSRAAPASSRRRREDEEGCKPREAQQVWMKAILLLGAASVIRAGTWAWLGVDAQCRTADLWAGMNA